MLLDLRRRGLTVGARLATADGALGFWAALREVYRGTEEQTCWFHKAGNVLDKMPQSVQSKATTMIREMWQTPSLQEATAAYDQFGEAWEAKYPKAVACLRKDVGVAVQLLLVSCRALGASADAQSDRIHLRHDPLADQADQGVRVAHGDADDGVETGAGSRQELASADGI